MNKKLTIKGVTFVSGINTMEMTDLVVRITKDKRGKTLSIANEKRGIQLTIPADNLAKLLE